MKKTLFIGLFMLLTVNMAFAGWVAKVKITGEDYQSAVKEGDCIIGVNAQEESIEAITMDPPEFTASLKMYDQSSTGQYYKLVYADTSDEFLWYLSIDPNGNVGSIFAPRTAILSWDPSDFDPSGTYQLIDISGTVIVDDMINTSEYSITSAIEQNFKIVFTPGGIGNKPPVLGSLSNIIVDEDADSMTIGFNISDPDGDDVVVNVEKNTNKSLVTAELTTESSLMLSFTKDQSGFARITLKASDGKATISEMFTVTVNPVDDAPFVKNPIADVSAVKDDENMTISLNSVFSDIDNDDDSIVKTAQSKNPDLVQASVTGNVLTLDFQTGQTGITSIDVIATSNGITCSHVFNVTVSSGESVQINLPDIKDISGAFFTVPISLVNPDNVNIKSLDLSIKAETGALKYVEATLDGGILADNYNLFDSSFGDEIFLSISFDRQAMMNSSGPIVNVKFQLTGEPCSSSNLVFTEAVLNEDQVNVINSTVKVTCDISCKDGSITTDEDTVVSGDLSELVTNPDNVDISFSVQQAEHGSIEYCSSSGKFQYTPNTDFYGLDLFVFEVSDNNYAPVTGTIKVTVMPVIDAQINLGSQCVSGYPGNKLRVPVNIVSDSPVSEINFTVTFDSQYLSANDVQVVQGYGFTATTDKQNNYLGVILSAESATIVSPTVAEIIFAVAPGTPAGYTGVMEISNNASVNGVGAEVNNGCFEIIGQTLTGRAIYFKEARPVPGVVITAQSSLQIYTTLTNNNGAYTITGLQPGQYLISAAKQDDLDVGLSPSDASFICQYMVKIRSLDCYEMVAADTSRNGKVYSMDASEIVLYLLSMQTCMNNDCNHWTFLKPDSSIEGCDGDCKIAYTSTHLVNITDNQSAQDINFIGIRLGDVTGNASFNKEITTMQQFTKSYSIPVIQGEDVSIPLKVNEWITLSGMNLTLMYDSKMLEAKKATLENGELQHHDYSVLTNARTPGKLHVIAFGRSNLATIEGNVLELNFKALASGNASLSIVDFSCNESECNGELSFDAMNAF